MEEPYPLPLWYTLQGIYVSEVYTLARYVVRSEDVLRGDTAE